MDLLFCVIGFLGAPISLIWLIICAVRKKSKKHAGIALLVSIVLFFAGALMLPSGETPQAGSAEQAEQTKKEKKPEYSLEFNPEYIVNCSDTSITIDVNYKCPDGALIQALVIDGTLEESYSDTLPVKDGKVSFSFDLENTDTKVYNTMLIFQFNSGEIVQPDNVKAVYGEYGEKLTGKNAAESKVEGHEDAKNATMTFSIDYPNTEAVTTLKNSTWNKYMTEIVNASDGLITNIRRTKENIYDVYFTNSWYLLSNEEKEYIANTLYDGIKTAAKNIYSEESISLYIYAGDDVVAESTILSDKMKLK